MTKLERARQFLTGTTRAIALKVVPLALVASSASYAIIPANSFLLTGQSVGTINNSGGSGIFFGSGAFSASPLALENGFLGLSLTGSVGVTCSGGSCGGETIDFNFQGHVTGPATPPATAGVFYRFSTSLSGDTGGPSYNWTFLGAGGSANYGSNVTGNGVMSLSGSNWSMDLDINTPTFNDGATLTLTLPTDAPASIDITAASATPEPASVALTMAAAAGWLFLRRKKRTS